MEVSKSVLKMNRLVFWTVLATIMVQNFLIAVFLIPFLLLLNRLLLDILIIIIAASFGALFSYIIIGVEHLEKRHHILAFLIILLMGLLNITISVSVADKAAAITGLQKSPASVLVLSLLYLVSFLTPYIAQLVLAKVRKE